MGKGTTPWSIKGIGPEAREAAKAAAAKEGLTLGAWLTKRVIMESIGEGPDEKVATAAQSSPADGPTPDVVLAALNEKLAGLTTQLDGMATEVSRISHTVEEAGVRVEVAERAAAEIAQSVSQSVAQTVEGSISQAIENRPADTPTAPTDMTAGIAAEIAETLTTTVARQVIEAVQAEAPAPTAQTLDLAEADRAFPRRWRLR